MSRYCVQIGWDEVPHLSADTKKALLDGMLPHMREARTKGIPMLGAGAIYPVPESVIVVEPFALPAFWPKAYALDVGWNRTAALWGAWSRDDDTVYLWSEHYVGQAPPAVHASAIAARGNWMTGAIDPAAAGANQKDGSRLIEEYRSLGLSLVEADNAVESGIHAVYQRMSTGRLKVFSTLRNWLAEFRIYRRDEKGRVVKENDHLMDCTKYLINTGMRFARVEPTEEDDWHANVGAKNTASGVTGY